MPLTHLNPSSMHRNPAFSQGVVIEPGSRLVVVGGQNGVDATGAVVGPGLREQTAQALRNVLTVLGEVGATQEDVAKLTIHPRGRIRRPGGVRGIARGLGRAPDRRNRTDGGATRAPGRPRRDRGARGCPRPGAVTLAG